MDMLTTGKPVNTYKWSRFWEIGDTGHPFLEESICLTEAQVFETLRMRSLVDIWTSIEYCYGRAHCTKPKQDQLDLGSISNLVSERCFWQLR